MQQSQTPPAPCAPKLPQRLTNVRGAASEAVSALPPAPALAAPSGAVVRSSASMRVWKSEWKGRETRRVSPPAQGAEGWAREVRLGAPALMCRQN